MEWTALCTSSPKPRRFKDKGLSHLTLAFTLATQIKRSVEQQISAAAFFYQRRALFFESFDLRAGKPWATLTADPQLDCQKQRWSVCTEGTCEILLPRAQGPASSFLMRRPPVALLLLKGQVSGRTADPESSLMAA